MTCESLYTAQVVSCLDKSLLVLPTATNGSAGQISLERFLQANDGAVRWLQTGHQKKNKRSFACLQRNVLAMRKSNKVPANQDCGKGRYVKIPFGQCEFVTVQRDKYPFSRSV